MFPRYRSDTAGDTGFNSFRILNQGGSTLLPRFKTENLKVKYIYTTLKSAVSFRATRGRAVPLAALEMFLFFQKENRHFGRERRKTAAERFSLRSRTEDQLTVGSDGIISRAFLLEKTALYILSGATRSHKARYPPCC